ncbi:MAG: peptide ABC transporter permease [Chloroflexota bacterium]
MQTDARRPRKRARPAGLRLRTALGLAIIGLIVLAAAVGPTISSHDPLRQDLGGRLRPPAWVAGGDPAYPLGTDQLGRDVLTRLVYGARTSLLIGFGAVLLSGTAGTLLGLIAGYYGGLADRAIMRLADIQFSFPFILLVITLVAVLGPGLGSVVLAMAVGGWATYARVVRAQVLALKGREFVEAARCLGAGSLEILYRHIFPGTVGPLSVIGTYSVGQMMVFAAALDFLGLGIQPPTPAWGTMLADGLAYLDTAWWLNVFPGLALVLTVLGLNLVGDAIRAAADPRLRRNF